MVPRSSRIEKVGEAGLSPPRWLSIQGRGRSFAGVLARVVQPLLQSSPPLAHQHPGSLGRGDLLGLWDMGPELELLAVAGPQDSIALGLLDGALAWAAAA
ncbi:hypothetical protein KBY57_12890 [Cyanobium sp. Aljojuca 7D2]|uniref:hypothetical protein n=1 Tax=Cyanobium sp. Aljojuca 7D2 TaxID=2823698 RepID=UPI0020CFC841|nr:hypothetical protein [Cyanobium sp. Aljojuca 7D2]MCP9891941.1 hypothetical protein [Cyanobium sp. Aljojuca 7D2]